MSGRPGQVDLAPDVPRARIGGLGTEESTQRRRLGLVRRIPGKFVVQIGAVVAAILAWLALVPLLNIPHYLWPSLPEVLQALWQSFVVLPATHGLFEAGALYDTLHTLETAAIGYALGTSIALMLAIAASEFRTFDYVIRPFISAFQALPKIALAPLFMIWFGLGLTSHIALVVSLVIFPVMLNAYAGMKDVSDEHLELAQSLRASRLRTLRLIKLPGALPSIMTGLRIGVVYALLATIVSEFLAGQYGLGAELTLAQSTFDTARTFAILVVLGVLGALLEGTVGWVGGRVVFWSGKR